MTPINTSNNSRLARCAVYLVSLALCSACGAAMSTQHGQAAGQWRVRLPQTHDPLAALAFGNRGFASASLEPTAPAPQDAPQVPLSHRRGRVQRVPAASQVAAPAVVPLRVATVEAAQTPVPAMLQQPPQGVSPVLASPAVADASRYAARDAQASKQQQFKAGDVIVISVTSLLIVAVLVLLLVLLLK